MYIENKSFGGNWFIDDLFQITTCLLVSLLQIKPVWEKTTNCPY